MHYSRVDAKVWRIGGEPKTIKFDCNHNGDFSGEVIISCPPDTLQFQRSDMEPYPYEEVHIPFQVMQELVAEWLVNERISKLENSDPLDLLKGTV